MKKDHQFNLEELKKITALLQTDKIIEIMVDAGIVKETDLITIEDDGLKKTSEIMQKCRDTFKLYSCYSDEQLDKYFPPVKSKRKFKNVREADEENANKSADDLKQSDQITLKERLLMELLYFKKTGNHLDIKNWTLCAGSRNSDGRVPRVHWRSGYREVYVDWCYPDLHHVYLRARSAVN